MDSEPLERALAMSTAHLTQRHRRRRPGLCRAAVAAAIVGAGGALVPGGTAGAASVHCPPRAGEGAVKVRDLDGDGVKDWRFDAKSGGFKRTETDAAGNKKELWCVDHGSGSTFVWMYIAATGEPGAGKKKYIGFCEFDGGTNKKTEKKATINGKSRFKSTTWTNTDKFNKDSTVKERKYTFDARKCKITQETTKDNGTKTTDKKDVDPPQEDGNGIGLPFQ